MGTHSVLRLQQRDFRRGSARTRPAVWPGPAVRLRAPWSSPGPRETPLRGDQPRPAGGRTLSQRRPEEAAI